MYCYNKIALFDLDDTLYNGNSHIEWLCYYYNTSFFKSFFFKAVAKIFPQIESYIIWKLYERVDDSKKNNFYLKFRQSVLDLLREKQKEGFFVLIISNAPIQLLKNAASLLQIDYLRAEVGKKSLILKKNYLYNELFVCTDNKTDIDLLHLADSSVIICKKKNQSFFKQRLNNKKIKFLITEDD